MSFLYVCTANASVTVVDTATGLIIAVPVVPSMATRGGPVNAAASPDGTRVAVTDWNTGGLGTVAFIDCTTNADSTVAASVPDYPWGLAWTAASDAVYVACAASVARVSRTGTVGPIIPTGPPDGFPKHGICVDLTGRLYAAYGWNAGSCGICEIVVGSSVVSIQNPSPTMTTPNEVCVSSDGTTVYATTGSGHIYPYTPGGFYGTPIAIPSGGAGICSDPNSLHLFTGSGGASVYAVPEGGTSVDHTFGGFIHALQCVAETISARVWFSQQNNSGFVTSIDTATMTVGAAVDVSILGTHVAWGMAISNLGVAPTPQWSIGNLRLRP